MVLSKSMQELNALADEMLKSQSPEKIDEKGDEELSPEGIAENAPTSGDNEGKTSDNDEPSKDSNQDNPDENNKEAADNSSDDSQLKKSEGAADEPSEDEKSALKDESEIVKSTNPSGATVKVVNENAANGDKLAKSENPEDEEEKVEELQKSFQETFQEDINVSKSIEASEFLKAVVEVLSKSLGQNSFDLSQMKDTQHTTNEVLAKSLQASLQVNSNLQKDIVAVRAENAELKKSMDGVTQGMNDILSKLDEFGHQPSSMRKSVGNIQVMDRDFKKSLDTGVNTGLGDLSKSEVLGMLNTEMYNGNPVITPTDIISYESGAPLRPEVATILATKLR